MACQPWWMMTLHAPPCLYAVDSCVSYRGVRITGNLILFYGTVYALQVERVVLIVPAILVIRRQRWNLRR